MHTLQNLLDLFSQEQKQEMVSNATIIAEGYLSQARTFVEQNGPQSVEQALAVVKEAAIQAAGSTTESQQAIALGTIATGITGAIASILYKRYNANAANTVEPVEQIEAEKILKEVVAKATTTDGATVSGLLSGYNLTLKQNAELNEKDLAALVKAGNGKEALKIGSLQSKLKPSA